MTASTHSSLVGTECLGNGTQLLVQEQSQESLQCCQCSSCSLNDPALSSGSSSSANENEKSKSRLSDYRVQDLKNECKKRQLPVSGAKPQLLERLRPYEDSILYPCAGSTLVTDAASDFVSVPSPVSDVSTQSNRLPPISNVIGDYVHKHSVSPLVQQQQQQQSQSASQHSVV
ncbi:unnamed protein product, partial [Gongylonema pulchrum]|uniref:SAP domain-containing protein n=1 Tax=Gongylonema pulchrum TaxID=637853 RepID=A0A183EV51_9BILA